MATSKELVEALREALYEEGYAQPYGPVCSSDYLPADTPEAERPAAIAALQAADAEVDRANDACMERVIAAVAPIIRADERERAGVRQEDTVTAHDPFCPMHDVEHLQAYVNKMKADARADERERLRAQVEALRDVDSMTVEETGLGDDYWAGYDDSVADVLALLGGDDS